MIHKTKTVLISSILALLTVVTTRNTQAQSLQSLTLEIHTADESWAGTDSDVFLQLFLGENDDQRDLKLDDPNDGNDFERNDRNTITLDHTNNLPSELWMIRMFRIHRNERSGPNDWKLAGIKIFMNGNPSLVLYENQNINTELDDDHPDWAPPVDAWVPPDPPPPPLPPCPLPQCRGPARPTGREGGGPYWIFPDRDCDGVDDAADNEFNPRDLDGDGLFDRCEDFDGDGVVDPEETDPNNRDTDGDGIPDPRDLLDTDADGLPDVYEDKNRNNQVDRGETDKNNPDTDGDGCGL